jgi:hypothetical protein
MQIHLRLRRSSGEPRAVVSMIRVEDNGSRVRQRLATGFAPPSWHSATRSRCTGTVPRSCHQPCHSTGRYRAIGKPTLSAALGQRQLSDARGWLRLRSSHPRGLPNAQPTAALELPQWRRGDEGRALQAHTALHRPPRSMGNCRVWRIGHGAGTPWQFWVGWEAAQS